jgi:hypothetical protein
MLAIIIAFALPSNAMSDNGAELLASKAQSVEVVEYNDVVVDFTDLTAGQIFNGDEYSNLGINFDNTPSSRPMVIQNSSDPNLPSPSQDHFNPLQGNVLIVSKYQHPNGSVREYASTHKFVMTFDEPVFFESVTTMDNESRGSKIKVFGERGLIKMVDVPVVPDGTNNWQNSLQTVLVNAEGALKVEFQAKGSTFIDDIKFGVSVPDHGPDPDDDNDGVPNDDDHCPNTPPGAEVDKEGCERDDDDDGVPNGGDQCPNTPEGTAVGPDGCERDDDGDGVPNGDDLCPGTPPSTEVDLDGCAIVNPAPPVTPPPAEQPVLLGNISTRAFVMDGPAKVVGGFIIRKPAGAPDENLCVVIRGRGQSVGLPNSDILLPDPQLTLWTRIEGVQTVINYNNDWQDDLDNAFNIIDSGFGDVMEPTDAGIYTCLPPGGYTAHLTSADGGDGIGIVEVFDADNYFRELDTVSAFDDSDDLY